jgi:hypothetical protein
MINFEKIKVGKSLTPNQKRIREIWLKHKANLEGADLPKKDFFNGHKVRLIKVEGFHINCSRGIEKKYIVFDNSQKENIKLISKDYISSYYKERYPRLADNVYIVIGKKNIIGYLKKKCGVFDGLLSMYDNKGIYSIVHPSINHRKTIEYDLGCRKTIISKKRIDKKWFYAHGKTKEESMQDLKYKIRIYFHEKKKEKREEAYRNFFKNLKFNSIIDIKRYRFLTGACQFGCEEFARRNNLNKNSRLRVSDLLKYLLPTDYGYDKLVGALGIAV